MSIDYNIYYVVVAPEFDERIESTVDEDDVVQEMNCAFSNGLPLGKHFFYLPVGYNERFADPHHLEAMIWSQEPLEKFEKSIGDALSEVFDHIHGLRGVTISVNLFTCQTKEPVEIQVEGLESSEEESDEEESQKRPASDEPPFKVAKRQKVDKE